MGMDDFKMTLLSDQVTVVREGEYWKLEGHSNCDVGSIHTSLNEICKMGKTDSWTYDDCIIVWTYDHRGYFQGIHLTGCLSYIKASCILKE